MPMRVALFEHEWNYIGDEGKVYNISNCCAVYVIAVKSTKSSFYKVAYIGFSESLRTRLLRHEVITILGKHKKDYEIEILYKDTGNKIKNYSLESYLIWRYQPPFNGGEIYGSVKDYSRWHLWADLGVKKVEVLSPYGRSKGVYIYPKSEILRQNKKITKLCKKI